MRREFAIALAVSFGAAAISSHPAWAEHRQDHGRTAKHHRVQRHAAPPAARICQRLCVADVTPCDPMDYKIADGRCSDMFFFY